MGSNENLLGVNMIRPSNVQGGKKPGGVGNNNNNGRKALSAIDKNIIVAPPHHCAVNKRALSTRENENENATCNKNPVAPSHRPVTRRFAAQLAGKQSLLNSQEAQPIIQPVSTAHHHDNDTPMYVHHMESMLEEIDRMDAEVEMEDDMDEDEAIVDIDTCDQNNPLAVSEYIDDLYTYYKKMEHLSCVPPNYMDHQPDINERMRGILIDWLIEVHYKFELMEETLYLTVNIIDRFLAAHSVVRKQLQLVGVTSLLLACKYEEVSVPVIEDLILITDRAYCRKDVLDMERLIVNTLQFNMSLPTPYVFMRRFLKAAQSDERMELVSFYIIELCLVEYEMLHFPPSLLAAAAVFTAQCTLNGCMQWSKTSEKHTCYTQDNLLECARLMVRIHEKAGSGKLTGVYKKYSTSKYGYAAKVGAASSVFFVTDK